MSKQGKNIYLRKDGQWEGRYVKGRTDDHIQYGYVYDMTYEAPERKLNEISSPCINLFNVQNATFDNIAEEWLQVQQPQLKASSIAKYTNIMKLYLIPRFGKQQICTISRNDIVTFSLDLLTTGGVESKGLSPKTVNSIISVLKNIFGYALLEKKLIVADISDISVKQPQKPMRILSKNEQQRLSRHLCNNPSPRHLGILLCLYTGLRIGEICALKWEDICITDQYLYVHQTMQRIQISETDGKKTQVVIQPPKSDYSVRKIPIPNKILQLLVPAQKSGDAFLLTGMANNYVEPRSMENYFKAVIKECDIHDVNFHALRHTFATRCIELGFDVKSLSEILGHASVNITMNRYVHPSMELKQRNMNLLSELLTKK